MSITPQESYGPLRRYALLGLVVFFSGLIGCKRDHQQTAFQEKLVRCENLRQSIEATQVMSEKIDILKSARGEARGNVICGTALRMLAAKNEKAVGELFNELLEVEEFASEAAGLLVARNINGMTDNISLERIAEFTKNCDILGPCFNLELLAMNMSTDFQPRCISENVSLPVEVIRAVWPVFKSNPTGRTRHFNFKEDPLGRQINTKDYVSFRIWLMHQRDVARGTAPSTTGEVAALIVEADPAAVAILQSFEKDGGDK
jgi:hypothetical protein